MIMCNAKGVAQRELSPYSAVPLNSVEHFSIFQLIVLVFWSAALVLALTLLR